MLKIDFSRFHWSFYDIFLTTGNVDLWHVPAGTICAQFVEYVDWQGYMKRLRTFSRQKQFQRILLKTNMLGHNLINNTLLVVKIFL